MSRAFSLFLFVFFFDVVTLFEVRVHAPSADRSSSIPERENEAFASEEV